MLRPISALIACTLLVVASACSDDESGADACKHFTELCGSDTAGVSGSDSLKATCDGDKLDKASNGADVKTCINKTKDCNTAVTCVLGTK